MCWTKNKIYFFKQPKVNIKTFTKHGIDITQWNSRFSTHFVWVKKNQEITELPLLTSVCSCRSISCQHRKSKFTFKIWHFLELHECTSNTCHNGLCDLMSHLEAFSVHLSIFQNYIYIILRTMGSKIPTKGPRDLNLNYFAQLEGM